MGDERRRYTFSPLERRGVLLGLGVGQLATIVIGLLGGLVAARVVGGRAGTGLAVVVALSFCVAAVWPVSGRSAAGWVPLLAGFAARRATGPRVHGGPASLDTALLPGIDVVDAAGVPQFGVVRDRRAGTCAAVVPVRGRAFALLDGVEQEGRLAAWGAILAGLARSRTRVSRIQWVERSASGESGGLRVPPAGGPDDVGALARDCYEALVAEAGPATQEHQVYLVLAVTQRRGTRPGAPDAADALRRELRFLRGRLRDAGLSVAAPLTATEVRSALADGFQGRLCRLPRAGAWPWAMATDEAWACLRTDASWHATYWVAEWPRVEVPADFLAPLLLVGGVRAVSVTMAPVPPEQAARQVESARTADLADDELRRRAGFLDTARRRRQADGVMRREIELADGHAEYRFSGYVTVSGPNRNGLEAACAELEQAAEAARLHLRRLYGQQAEAFTWTLPLARGLG